MEAIKRRAIKRESKTQAVLFKLRPSIYKKAQRIAYVKYDTVNNLVNTMLELYVQENQDALKEYDILFPDNVEPIENSVDED